jgi:hypothetical protein
MMRLNRGSKALAEAEAELNDSRTLTAITQELIADRIRQLYVEVTQR